MIEIWNYLAENWEIVTGIIVFIGSLITFLIRLNIKINNATNEAKTANKGLESHEKLIDEKVKSIKGTVDLNNTNMETNIKGIDGKLDLIIDNIKDVKSDVKDVSTEVVEVGKKVAKLEGKIECVVPEEDEVE